MDDHPSHRIFATSMVVMAAVWAYFASSLLAFADQSDLAVFGGLFGIGAGGTWLAMREVLERHWGWTFGTVFILSTLMLLWQLNLAMTNYGANEKRCVALQRDMLSAKPRRADGPALFEALNCNPSGTEPVHYKDVVAPAPPT